MRILGIDPGTATTGFGVIDYERGQYAFVDAGVITTKPDLAMSERLAQIHADLTELIAEFKPETAAIELLFFGNNVTTAMTVGQARGVAMLALQTADVPIAEYNPMQIKLAVAGYGGAKKPQMQEMVKMLLGLPAIPKPDDAADALAIAITHANSAR
jgi:crossover junction endodeoxyribonuclease RuvC